MRLSFFFLAAVALAQNPQAPQGVPENATKRISEHVYAISGFPNVGIVVGDRATLVIDTGMGAKNGAVVMREVDKLAKSPNLYLTTTHFHPEHAAGEQAFPPRTVIVRPAVQQEELEKRGDEFIEMFRGRSAANKELLQDVKLRKPDFVYPQEVTLDLGGVTARLFWLGAAHTKGDELIMIEPDSVLLSGDIVQDKMIPNIPNADGSTKNWLAILDKLEPLKPKIVFPDHGGLGDASLIGKEKAFLTDLRNRALELKRQGIAVDQAIQTVTAELKTKYVDWTGNPANAVRRVYEE